MKETHTLLEYKEALKEVVDAFGPSEKWEAITSLGGIFDEAEGDFVYAWNGDRPLDHLIKAKKLLEAERRHEN